METFVQAEKLAPGSDAPNAARFIWREVADREIAFPGSLMMEDLAEALADSLRNRGGRHTGGALGSLI